MKKLFILCFVFWSCVSGCRSQETSYTVLAPDESVTLFPTAAVCDQKTKTWRVPIHGWVFEPEENSLKRLVFLKTLEEILEKSFEPSDNELALFVTRVRSFIVDNKRGKKIVIDAAGQRFVLKNTSEEDGHFIDEIKIPAKKIKPGQIYLPLSVPVTKPEQTALGASSLIPPQGLTVISDIDDTIKISNVSNKKELMLNTFFRPYQAVPGMAELYRGLHDQGAWFHYVSSSPWQLYRDLNIFMRDREFPFDALHLKRIRLLDKNILELFADPLQSKIDRIAGVIQTYPEHQFVLVGDSGEKDPEVYGEIARRFPKNIQAIWIRSLTVMTQEEAEPRFTDAFHDLDNKLWTVFNEPKEINTSVVEKYLEDIKNQGANHENSLRCGG